MKLKHIMMLLLVVIISLMAIKTAIGRTIKLTKIENENQFYLDYKIFNKNITHSIKLKKGDQLQFDIFNTKGKVRVSVNDSMGKSIYKNENVKNANYIIFIKNSGEYIISVLGVNAEGSSHFEKITRKTCN